MRGFLTTVLAAGLLAAAPARAQVTGGDPDLAIRVVNALADVCIQAARGHPPTRDTAGRLGLDPVAVVPPALAERFGYLPTWFALAARPRNVFVAVGDKPGACHIVLADTTQTVEVQAKVGLALKATGFRSTAPAASVDPGMSDQLFVGEAPDGFVLINIHAPRQTLRDGQGAQGSLHVSLIPNPLFASPPKRP